MLVHDRRWQRAGREPTPPIESDWGPVRSGPTPFDLGQAIGEETR
jgi:hypothetical protein